MNRRDRSLDLNEQSPLIRAEDTAEDGDINDRPLSDSMELEDSTVQSKSSLYLILLTLSIAGLQIVWSVEMSNGSPFLLSLGMSKALLAFVWLAGPMTGVLVQPYIGIVSDRCRISWGKRKPFMIAGTLGTVASSMLLAYSREIIWFFGGMNHEAKYEGAYMIATITFATVMMWVLDFSINTVQAAIRAFIVDGAPAHQQESANAWASRMTGIGNVFGYVFGYLDLPHHFSFFGNTQFKVLVAIASIALSSTILMSTLAIKERNPQLDSPSKSGYDSPSLFSFLKQVFVSIKRLPPQTKKVCEIQFCYWIGWFPFLFYITTYIGQLYINPFLTPGLSDEEVDKLWAKATRVGTLALLIYAITSFGSNIILPFLVVPTYKAPTDDVADHAPSFTPTSPIGPRHHNASHSDLTHSRSQSSSSDVIAWTETYGQEISKVTSRAMERCLNRIKIPGLTLRRAWLLSQLLFVACMFSTFFISTPLAATIMTAFVGISWSLTLWAPFALISAEIATRDELRRRRQRNKLQNGDGGGDGDDLEEEEDQAGIILGLHNVAVSAPQVLATLISSIVFKVLQKDRGVPGDTSVGWTLRIGGLATLIAAFITWRMKEAGDTRPT